MLLSILDAVSNWLSVSQIRSGTLLVSFQTNIHAEIGRLSIRTMTTIILNATTSLFVYAQFPLYYISFLLRIRYNLLYTWELVLVIVIAEVIFRFSRIF